MGSRFAAILAEEQSKFYEPETPTSISEINEASNCYFLVYDGPYQIAEGSLISIKYKLPLEYIERKFSSWVPNPDHPRIITIRL